MEHVFVQDSGPFLLSSVVQRRAKGLATLWLSAISGSHHAGRQMVPARPCASLFHVERLS